MMSSADPLLLSSRASRRLQLLFAHGAHPQESTGGQPVEEPCGWARGAAQLRLEAGVLPAPPTINWGALAPPWLSVGDPLAEVAVHLHTLRQLRVAAGSLVEVRNAARPDLLPRLARVFPSPTAPREGALIAPGLAYSLGLPLHLSPFLRGGCSDRSSASHVLLAPYTGPPAASHAAANAGGGSSSWHQEGQTCVTLPQPAGEAACVPLAQVVHLALVRSPTTALLASSRHGPGPTSSAPGSGPGAPKVAGQGPGEAGGEAAAGSGSGGRATRDEDGEVLAALRRFFLSQTRLLCVGDMLAVRKQRAGASALALPNLLQPVEDQTPPQAGSVECSSRVQGRSNGTDSGLCCQPSCKGEGGTCEEALTQQGAGGHGWPLPPELLYLRVVRALPEGGFGPLAVDAARTQVKLVGSCSSGVPPGVAAYLALPPQGQALGTTSSVPEPGGHVGAGAQAAAWRMLAELLASSLHPEGAHLPLRLAVLLHGPPGSGKCTAVAAAAQAVGCHVVTLSCHDIRPAGTPEKRALEGLQAAFEASGQYRPAVLLLRHFEAIAGEGAGGLGGGNAFAARAGAALADCIRSGFRPAPAHRSNSVLGLGSEQSGEGSGGGGEGHDPAPLFPCPLVLVACTESPDRVPPPLRRCFTHELAADPPDQACRAELLGRALRGAGAMGLLGLEALEEAARHSAGLLPREIQAVVAGAAALATGEILPAAHLLWQPAHAAISWHNGAAPSLSEHHLSRALESVRQRNATDIGAPKIPDVKWEDVGGLEDVKRAILDTVELPLKHPELFAGGLRRRSGVLLYGPPGTGKTLLAKAVATECNINFLSVKGPELINMYVGESERQIREVFARARRARPCVVFFDELDSLAPARGKGSDSGGVMDRVVAQLLAEVDGVQGGAGDGDLFIIGATNRPDLLDPALMRPGRLDRLLYVGIAGDPTSRLRVLEALTRKFTLDPSVDLGNVADRCPSRFTGADMYALCSDAWMTAMRREIAEGGDSAMTDGAGEAVVVVVAQSDFDAALANLQPSLSEDEAHKYERIRDQWSQPRQAT